MEARVRKLEESVVRIDEKLTHLATKADLVEQISGVRSDLTGQISGVKIEMTNMKSSLIQWFVATAVALTVAVCAIARYLPPAP